MDAGPTALIEWGRVTLSVHIHPPPMPRTIRKPQSAPIQDAPPRELILVAEAARRCGWRRANTFRERFLGTEGEALTMGLSYDEQGRAIVAAQAVAVAVAQLAKERAARPLNWRLANLGKHARARATKRATALPPNVRP